MLRDMVSALFDILYYLILIRIILSFFPISPYGNPTLLNIIYFLRQLRNRSWHLSAKLFPHSGWGSISLPF